MVIFCPICQQSWATMRLADEHCPHWDYEHDPRRCLPDPIDDDTTCTWDVQTKPDGSVAFDNIRPLNPGKRGGQ